jgi:hypothetical protein
MDDSANHDTGKGGGKPRNRGGWKAPIGDEAKGLFLAGLKRGLSMEDAARNAGYSPGGFWKARQRDPAFDEAVEEMLELSNTPRFISPGNGRRWQLRRIRRLRFVAWRKEVFLAHVAGTCDLKAAAEAAGICVSTVHRHLAKDPDFAALFQQALEVGYPLLEAEALRQRLEVQRLLREGLLPAGEIPAEFERILKLLQRWDRRNGKVGPRIVAHSRRQPMSFAQAIEELDCYLVALGIPMIGEEEQGTAARCCPQSDDEGNEKRTGDIGRQLPPFKPR